MFTITLQEAREKLDELIHQLNPGEEVIITENNRPVARLMAEPSSPPRQIPKIGTQRGSVLSMEHFDDPLDDFKEYIEDIPLISADAQFDSSMG